MKLTTLVGALTLSLTLSAPVLAGSPPPADDATEDESAEDEDAEDADEDAEDDENAEDEDAADDAEEEVEEDKGSKASRSSSGHLDAEATDE